MIGAFAAKQSPLRASAVRIGICGCAECPLIPLRHAEFEQLVVPSTPTRRNSTARACAPEADQAARDFSRYLGSQVLIYSESCLWVHHTMAGPGVPAQVIPQQVSLIAGTWVFASVATAFPCMHLSVSCLACPFPDPRGFDTARVLSAHSSMRTSRSCGWHGRHDSGVGCLF